jgi:hypothetical protein
MLERSKDRVGVRDNGFGNLNSSSQSKKKSEEVKEVTSRGD